MFFVSDSSYFQGAKQCPGSGDIIGPVCGPVREREHIRELVRRKALLTNSAAVDKYAKE